MKILSHRGYWLEPAEKNTAQAFHRSFSLGFGTETDIRDQSGELVISHDMPLADAMPFEAFLDIYCQYDKSLPLALNIKADGLAKPLLNAMRRRGLDSWFTFDMSVPDLRAQLLHGVPAFTRESELEQLPALAGQAQGLWADGFAESFPVEQVVARCRSYFQVCLVSPDLHKREYRAYWASLRANGAASQTNLMLCTDFPEEAAAFFKEGLS